MLGQDPARPGHRVAVETDGGQHGVHPAVDVAGLGQVHRRRACRQVVVAGWEDATQPVATTAGGERRPHGTSERAGVADRVHLDAPCPRPSDLLAALRTRPGPERVDPDTEVQQVGALVGHGVPARTEHLLRRAIHRGEPVALHPDPVPERPAVGELQAFREVRGREHRSGVGRRGPADQAQRADPPAQQGQDAEGLAGPLDDHRVQRGRRHRRGRTEPGQVVEGDRGAPRGGPCGIPAGGIGARSQTRGHPATRRKVRSAWSCSPSTPVLMPATWTSRNPRPARWATTSPASGWPT